MIPTTESTHPPRTTTEAAAPPLDLDPARDARDVFLTAAEVHRYLGLARTRGYEVTSSAAFQGIAALAGKWRRSSPLWGTRGGP